MPVDKKTLYPYLGANDLYGYADTEGHVVIEPEYTHAGFFHHGLAIVRKEGGKESLINTDNRVVALPTDYDELRLYPIADHVFIETTGFYTNRWRFWEWKFLPGFSIIGGGSSDSRLFDTEVAREKRTLYWWEGGKKLKAKRGTRLGRETMFFLNGLGDGVVQIDDGLYRLEGDEYRKLAGSVAQYKTVNGGYLMQERAGGYRLVDRYGKRISKDRFKPAYERVLDVGGSEFVLKTQVDYSMPGKRVDIYVDNADRAFIYPDLEKEFPTHIHTYHLADTVSTEDILDGAQNIASIPNTDRFIFVLDFGKRVYVMDTEGKWHDPTENYGDFRVVSAGAASILWPPHAYFAGDASLPEGWAIRSIREFGHSEGLFRVSVGREEERRMGIWDSNTQQWIMEPGYHTIDIWTYKPPYIAFQKEKDGKWGYFDLANGRIHIPSTYDRRQSSGWVGIDGEETRPLFYLDVESKREFRAR